MQHTDLLVFKSVKLLCRNQHLIIENRNNWTKRWRIEAQKELLIPLKSWILYTIPWRIFLIYLITIHKSRMSPPMKHSTKKFPLANSFRWRRESPNVFLRDAGVWRIKNEVHEHNRAFCFNVNEETRNQNYKDPFCISFSNNFKLNKFVMSSHRYL
jgi:hypothetical protein